MSYFWHVTVQYELFQAVSVVRGLAVSFITSKLWQGHLLLCTRSCVWQCRLVMCNSNLGGVIDSCAGVYFWWNLNQDGGLEIETCDLLSTLSGYFLE